MNEISLIICDNEETICYQLTVMAEKLAEELNLAINIFRCHSAEELLLENLDNYNILFLDIELEGKDGFWAAKQIRKINTRIEIVFVTILSQRCSEGYQYRAYRYLTKPVNYDNFRANLIYLFEQTAVKEHAYQSFREGIGKNLPVYTKIYYIEVIDHTIYYHTKDAVLEYTGSMKRIEELYSRLGFCRIHQSYLVNMDKIEKIFSDKILLENKTELTVSRGRVKEFKNKYAEFVISCIK